MPSKFPRTVQGTLRDVSEFKTQCGNELRANNPLVQVICWWRVPATHVGIFKGEIFGALATICFLETSVCNGTSFPSLGKYD